jgi:hypothetical protein
MKRRKRQRRALGRRAQWECNSVERQFNSIEPKEMRQRLAECLDILVSSKSQFTEEIAFSNDPISSQNAKPRFTHKRKGQL